MGKSRGGLSTKTHAAVDALGNPVRLLLTAGQASEHTQAEVLIEGFNADFVLADKGYGSDAFVATIMASGAAPEQPDYAQELRQGHLQGTQLGGTVVPKS